MGFLKKLFPDREAGDPAADQPGQGRDPVAQSQPLDYVAETSFSWQGEDDSDSGYDPYDTARLRAYRRISTESGQG